MVICLERDADLHVAQPMPLPLTVSCFSKIEIGFTFLVPAHQGSPGKRAVKRVCVCVWYVFSIWENRGAGAMAATAPNDAGVGVCSHKCFQPVKTKL